jgi:hypothetical protein
MWTVIQIELFKIFRRPRTYIAFAAITGLIGIIQFGLKLEGDAYVDFMMRDITSSLTIEGKILNGYQVCYIILTDPAGACAFTDCIGGSRYDLRRSKYGHAAIDAYKTHQQNKYPAGKIYCGNGVYLAVAGSGSPYLLCLPT